MLSKMWRNSINCTKHRVSTGQTMNLTNNTAFIIIDQQQGLNHPKLGPRNNPDAKTVMLKLLKALCTDY